MAIAIHPLRITSLLGICAICAPAIAAPPLLPEERLQCPPEIAQASLPLAHAPDGWTSSTRGSLILHAADLSYGPPSELAFLKPEVIEARGKKAFYRWRDLQAGGTFGGVWVACNYGRSDNVILGKRLDDNVRECSAVDTRDEQGRYRIEVICHW